MENKRYWLFQPDRYDALGGMADITDTYDTVEEATRMVKEHKKADDVWYVLDTLTMTISAGIDGIDLKWIGTEHSLSGYEHTWKDLTGMTVEQLK